MRHSVQFGIDVVLVLAATVLALGIRDNFEFFFQQFPTYLLYLGLTIVAAGIVIPVLGLHRSVWRFSTMTDYLHLLAASVAIVLGVVILGFTISRLEGVARSIPILQLIMIFLLLVGARVFMRLRHAPRARPAKQFSNVPDALNLAEPSVLIVGLNRLTELYLQSAYELNPGHVRIAGLVGHNERHTGRLMHRYPVLGPPEQLAEIIKRNQVHGVIIDRIVVTNRWDSLSQQAQTALREVEMTSDVRVEFLAQTLGFEAAQNLESTRTHAEGSLGQTSDGALNSRISWHSDILAISEKDQVQLKRRNYWHLKRAIDVVGALTLLCVLAPVMAVAAILVLCDVGRPILFWQQRPGLAGRAFRLNKFRTMAAAHDANGNLVPDEERLSGIGRFLRRTRMDELPQLLHVLSGQMSFVGPRPLLPVDQPIGYAARLLVRPGLTGWAQVQGGRRITPLDKAALDIWYIRNASLALDLQILLRTAAMVVFGEKANVDAIRKAWADLKDVGLPQQNDLIGAESLVLAKRRSAHRRVA